MGVGLVEPYPATIQFDVFPSRHTTKTKKPGGLLHVKEASISLGPGKQGRAVGCPLRRA